ncbi:MAG: PhnA domain-containing protein [Bacteroidota bacterium]
MAFEKELSIRSGSVCELCSSANELSSFEVTPRQNGGRIDDFIFVCETCKSQIENSDLIEANHWRCLNDSMWSEIPAVQVVAWRMLNRIKNESWPQDLLEMLYLDEETLSWAKASGDGEDFEGIDFHKDSNGVRLESGDTVTLIKDLNVKGGGFTAKRGTAVRNIKLVMDNPEHIEGKVDGQTIVILTQYTRK